MTFLRRGLAILFAALALFLVYAVIHAVGSAGGAKVGASVAYVAGALVLLAMAARLWGRRGARV